MKTLYQILELQSFASQEEIRKAYRRLSLRYHPDKNNGENYFEEKFKEINSAYATLSNVQKRQQYDSQLKVQEDVIKRNKEDEINRKRREANQKAQEDAIKEKTEEELNRQKREAYQRTNTNQRKNNSNTSQQTNTKATPNYQNINSNFNSIKSKGDERDKLFLIFFVGGIFALLIICICVYSGREQPIKTDQQLIDTAVQKPLIKHYKPKKISHKKVAVPVAIDSTASIDDLNDTVSSVIKDTNSSYPLFGVDDTIKEKPLKKPKWYQFKKRKLWRKQKKENSNFPL